MSSRNDLPFLLFALCLITVSLFINLSIVPFYLEEPRRALIAMEMMLRGNCLVPTELGEFYYNKPPFFNWLIIIAFKLFGGFKEIAPRAVTVISFLLMGIVNYWFVKTHKSKSLAVYSTLFLLISVDIYFYFSLIGEIDIFYSLISYTSIILVYHFYKKEKFLLLFLSLYLLNAIGFLTKGIPSLLFIAITLIVFLGYKKELRKLFSVQHLAGIGTFLLIVGGYFFAYSQFNSPLGFIHQLWSQSSDRTATNFDILALLKHFAVFPLETLKNVLPASLFLLFFQRKFLKALWKDDFLKFCLLMFVSHFLVYWISPGSKSRYIYMLFPFLIIMLVQAFLKARSVRLVKALDIIIGTLILSMVIGAFCLSFIKPLVSIEHILAISIIAVTAFLGLFLIYIFRKSARIKVFIMSIILIRIVFDLTVLPLRAESGTHYYLKQQAEKIATISKGKNLYYYEPYKEYYIPCTLPFYITKERQEVLKINTAKDCASYFIAAKTNISDRTYHVYHTYIWHGYEFYLLKFTDCQTPNK